MPELQKPADVSSPLFRLTGVGVVETDMRSGRLIRMNETFCRLLGYTEAELLGLSFRDLTHPDDLRRDEAAFLALQRGETQAGQSLTRVLHKDGSVRWLELAVTVVGEKGGVRNLAVVSDVTERKRAEANLAFLAEVSQDLVRLTTVDDTMRTLGAKVGRFFGAAQCLFAEHADGYETSVVSYGWNAVDAPDLKGMYRTRDFFEDELMTALAAGEPLVVGETRTDPRVSAERYGALGVRAFIIIPLLREGEWRFQLSVIDDKPRTWRTDEVELMQELTARIWTRLERARAEAALQELNETLERQVEERTEALRRSQQRFVQAFNVGPVAACITTPDEGGTDREVFLEVNDEFCKLTGYARDEAVGRSARELGMWSSAEDRKTLTEAGRNEFHNLDLHLRTKSGGVRDILLSGTTIRLDGHDGLLKLFYDVTERKRTEAQLVQAIQEVMSDTAWFSQSVLERLARIKGGGAARETAPLSPRERQVLERLAQGKSNLTIAEDLELKTQTVRNYISTIYDKLGIHSRAEAVVWARERGLAGL